RNNIRQIRTARRSQPANQKIERHFAQSLNANEALPVQVARPGLSSAQIAPSRERRNRRYLTVDHTYAVRFLHAYIPQGDGYQQEEKRQYCSCYNPVTAATINCGDRKRISHEACANPISTAIWLCSLRSFCKFRRARAGSMGSRLRRIS